MKTERKLASPQEQAIYLDAICKRAVGVYFGRWAVDKSVNLFYTQADGAQFGYFTIGYEYPQRGAAKLVDATQGGGILPSEMVDLIKRELSSLPVYGQAVDGEGLYYTPPFPHPITQVTVVTRD